MSQTRRQQFAIPKPDDRFAADMLRYLTEKYNAPQCPDLKVKVLHYGTLDQWRTLWPLASAAFERGRVEKEYGKALKINSDNWVIVNAYVFQVAGLDAETGEVSWADEQLRKDTMIGCGLSPELADALSPFDAVIFVNQHNIMKAYRAGQAFPLHGPVTHECIHIIERRTGQQVIKDFDREHYYHDEFSAEVLSEFIDKIGLDEFVRRYLTKQDM